MHNSWRLISVCLIVFLLSVAACLPLGPPNAVSVILKTKDLDLKNKKVLVPDFYLPEHGEGLGGPLADTLTNVLIEETLFQGVSRDLPVVWMRTGETLDARLAELASKAAQKGFDYIWVGTVEQIFFGGLVDSTLSITLRLIEAKSGTIHFIASNKAVSSAKDPSYPLDTQLTKPADGPMMLAEKLLKQIVARLK